MIRTKIARIISPTRVVLAAGAKQGINEGMEFIIYELSDPIFDPETKESLGELELHKGRVKVIHVQENLSTAMTLLRKVYQPGLFEGFIRVPDYTKGQWVEQFETLPIDESETVALKDHLLVHVGDLARSVSDAPAPPSRSNGPQT